MKKILYILLFIATGCSDILDTKPVDKITAEDAITSIEDLKMATIGAYDNLSSPTYYQGKYLVMADLMGDDFMNPTIANGALTNLYNYVWMEKSVDNSFYTSFYYSMLNINDILERSEFLSSDPIYNKYVAELKCLRALHHFNLVKIYGPLYANLGKGDIKEDALGIYISDHVRINPQEPVERNTVKEVYEFVIDELETNIDYLPSSSLNYLSQDAVNLLLARIYLYKGGEADYIKSLEYAEKVIPSGSLIGKDDYVDSWKQAHTSESIFVLPVSSNDNAGLNSIGSYVSSLDDGLKEISATPKFLSLVDAADDVRMELLVPYTARGRTYYLPEKKFPGDGQFAYVNNINVLRLSEAYLIAAECELKLGREAKAGEYLTELRKNRTDIEPEKYLQAITLDDILYERRLELFCEGHRCYDLWRNQLSVIRYSDINEKNESGHNDSSDGIIEYDFYKTIYPIAEQEMEFMKNKNQQNPNY